MAETTVVNIKLEACDVFIGRPSKFGNPFKIGRDGTREEVIEKYEAFIRGQLRNPKVRQSIRELRGKRLGCYCAPEACHGDVLAKLAKELTDAAVH